MRKASIVGIIITFGILFLIDYYAYQGVRILIKDLSNISQNIAKGIYWGIVLITYFVFLGMFKFGLGNYLPPIPRNFIFGGIFIIYLSKLVFFIFLLFDDVIRGVKYIAQNFQDKPKSIEQDSPAISRSEFLVKTGAVIASTPIIASTYGILSGAHDYRIRREKIVLPNLPKEFHGIRMAQISDIHSGSFFNKVAVKGGVEMLLAEKPDITFFTGDLVNNKSEEINDYIQIFEKVKSPLGVYSILGNHDYGMYVDWETPEKEIANLNRLKQAHKVLGWDLLLDEHRPITVDGESIGILGIENWGEGFIKKGDLAKAHQYTDHFPVKILLSHDPSHWNAQVLPPNENDVNQYTDHFPKEKLFKNESLQNDTQIQRPDYSDIDLMLAGHTHGFQFGIEVGNFKWSPVQYRYKQWAGLYKEGNQHLYVNRGYGYLGFPGRVGMPPEITIIELLKG